MPFGTGHGKNHIVCVTPKPSTRQRSSLQNLRHLIYTLSNEDPWHSLKINPVLGMKVKQGKNVIWLFLKVPV